MKRFIGGMATGMALVGICWLGSPPKIKTVEVEKVRTVYVPQEPQRFVPPRERLSLFERANPGWHQYQREQEALQNQRDILKELKRQNRDMGDHLYREW